MKNYLFVWDITSGIEDKFIYKVECWLHKEKNNGMVDCEARERAVNKARYMSFKLNGIRKCFMLSNEGSEPYQKDHGKVIVEVPNNTPQLKKWQGKTAKPIANFEFGDEFEWEDFLYSLKEKMGSHEYFKIGGKNIDWLNRSGEKYIHADTAQKLMDALYHEDIVELYSGDRKEEFKLRIPHHDCPMGSYYYIKPISEKTYEKEEGSY